MVGRIHLVNGNWTMAGVWVPYWTCISEAGFDIPAVLFLADEAQATLVQVVQCNLILSVRVCATMLL